MSRLAGRHALVIGAAGGIGSAIAYAYAREGADVTLADLDEGRLDAVLATCRTLGSRATAYTVDLRSEDSVRELREQIDDVDILVNSAGMLVELPYDKISATAFDEMMAVALRGVFLTCREFAPAMVEVSWGRIINIASQLGITGGARLSHYAAAKAGVLALTKSLARELAPHNVLVNAIAPGPIDTAMTDSITTEWRDAKLKELPLGRFGTPNEVAPAAVFLASQPDGNLFVGQTLGPNSGDVMP